MFKKSLHMARTVAFIFISFLFVFPACSQDSGSAGKPNQTVTSNTKYPASGIIDAATFKARLEEMPDAILVDIRTPQEFNARHMEGAKNIDFYEGSFNDAISKLPRDKPIFIYCHSGNRSGQAGQRMASMGFQHVYDLKGGISRWPF